ncbi:hypothetical protein DFH08DRAFT_816193 [Mycena albidolilacea]|uniref:Uncharacterized protein n=1 Tax=Mycena albidolilacea TaxID=1033008 RepID=A0AAD6ZMB3_9AGAR|nr:hypothetical protein DFH08DRAFT_816193 [Mycena albidolilacea]
MVEFMDMWPAYLGRVIRSACAVVSQAYNAFTVGTEIFGGDGLAVGSEYRIGQSELSGFEYYMYEPGTHGNYCGIFEAEFVAMGSSKRHFAALRDYAGRCGDRLPRTLPPSIALLGQRLGEFSRETRIKVKIFDDLQRRLFSLRVWPESVEYKKIIILPKGVFPSQILELVTIAASSFGAAGLDAATMAKSRYGTQVGLVVFSRALKAGYREKCPVKFLSTSDGRYRGREGR